MQQAQPRTVGGPAQDQASPWWAQVDKSCWLGLRGGGGNQCEVPARPPCVWLGVSLALRASVSLSVGIRRVGAHGQRPCLA